MINNYLKVHNPKVIPSTDLVFFDDEDARAVEASFASALAKQRRMGGGDISVYRAPRTRALEGVALIGHRR